MNVTLKRAVFPNQNKLLWVQTNELLSFRTCGYLFWRGHCNSDSLVFIAQFLIAFQNFEGSAFVEAIASNLRLDLLHFVPHVLHQFLEITYQQIMILSFDPSVRSNKSTIRLAVNLFDARKGNNLPLVNVNRKLNFISNFGVIYIGV